MKLILTRHGETIENQKGILQGHLPGILSKKGIKQAKTLALRLKNYKIDYIYSSDSARAANTTREITKYHSKIPVCFTEELRETNLGSWTGKNIKEIDKNNPPKNLETKIDLQKRARKFLDEIYNQHPDATILVVAHNWINKAIISYVLNKDEEDMDKLENQKNTSLNIFEIYENKIKICLMNCTKHLEEL